MRSKKLIVLVLGATFILLGFMEQIPFAFANTASSAARSYTVWFDNKYQTIGFLPVPAVYLAVGRLDVSCMFSWDPSWGYTITAGSWAATAMYCGTDIPFIAPLYVTYFQMTIHAYATPLRGSCDRWYTWEAPPQGATMKVETFSHSMGGSFGVRCMSAELTVTLHVHMTSAYGPWESTLSTTAYAP